MALFRMKLRTINIPALYRGVERYAVCRLEHGIFALVYMDIIGMYEIKTRVIGQAFRQRALADRYDGIPAHMRHF